MKVCKREKLAYEYGNLFTEALKIVNYRKKLLYTIWDDIGEDPFEIYVPYIITPIFSAMERIKISSLLLK